MSLDATDIRNVFALIDHLRAVGTRPTLWKPCMLSNLCRMFQARLGICLESVTGGRLQAARRGGALPDIVVALPDGGFLQSGKSAADRRGEDFSTHGSPVNFMAGMFCIQGRSSDESRSFETIHGRCGDVLCSQQHFVSHGRRQNIFLLRHSHDPAFNSREHMLLALFHAEFKRAVTKDDRSHPPTRAMPCPALSPRLVQTLELLAEGLSEKQVAAKLGCRPNTTHGYIKELHRRFAVNSRAELLAVRARIHSQSAGRLQF